MVPILTLIRFMLTDPKVWGDPEVFRPERFLAPDADSLPNPMQVIFGYGMRYLISFYVAISYVTRCRTCPGMYLADRGGFHVAASMATLYEISPLAGKTRPKPELVEYVDGIIRCVMP